MHHGMTSYLHVLLCIVDFVEIYPFLSRKENSRLSKLITKYSIYLTLLFRYLVLLDMQMMSYDVCSVEQEF